MHADQFGEQAEAVEIEAIEWFVEQPDRTRLQQQARQRGTSLLAGRQQAATAQACARRQLHVHQRRIDADGRRGIDATAEPQILDRTELRSEEHTAELKSLMRK